MSVFDWIKQKSQRELAAGARAYNSVKNFVAPKVHNYFSNDRTIGGFTKNTITGVPNAFKTLDRIVNKTADSIGNYGLDVFSGKKNLLPYANTTPKFMDAPRLNTLKKAYNFGAGTVNSIGSEGVIRPLNDIVDNSVRSAYDQPLRRYNELQSGAAKIGYDLTGQGGRNFQNIAGDVGQTVMPILDAWGVSKGLNLLNQSYKQALKSGNKELAAKLFKEYAKKSSREGGRIGLASGLAGGAQEGRDMDLGSNLFNTATSGVIGYLGGRGLGYVLPHAGRGMSRIISDAKLKLKPNTTRVVKANINGEAMTLPELESKLAQEDKTNWSGQKTVEDIKNWAKDIWDRSEKRVFEAVEPFEPESIWFRGAQKLDEKGVRPGMTIKETSGIASNEGVSKEKPPVQQFQPQPQSTPKVPIEMNIDSKAPIQTIDNSSNPYNTNTTQTEEYINSLVNGQKIAHTQGDADVNSNRP